MVVPSRPSLYTDPRPPTALPQSQYSICTVPIYRCFVEYIVILIPRDYLELAPRFLWTSANQKSTTLSFLSIFRVLQFCKATPSFLPMFADDGSTLLRIFVKSRCFFPLAYCYCIYSVFRCLSYKVLKTFVV